MARTLTGTNQLTQWWDLRGTASPVNFNLDGDFVEAVSIQYSNDESYAKSATSVRTDVTTFSAPAGPLQLPLGIALFVRFASGGSWTAGKVCTPRFSETSDPSGQRFIPVPQEQN
jgi:hypothetical protein